MKKELANLDILRSIAVLSVLFAHLWQYFDIKGPLEHVEIDHHFGSFGVILFFVHTSLVLMYSLDRQTAKGFGDNWMRRFYLRRAFRIYPLSVFCVLAVVVFNLPLGGIQPFGFEAADLNSTQVFANFILLQNFFKQANIIGPLWTLPIEIQMYLVLPFIWLAVKKINNIWSLGAIYLVMAAIVGLVQPEIAQLNQQWDIYQIPNIWEYIPCFLPGIMAYWMLERGMPNKIPWWILPLLLVGLSILNLKTYSIYFNFFICLSVGGLIPFLKEPTSHFVKFISAQVAKYSYGIYLLHFFAMYFSFEYCDFPLVVQSLIFAVTLSLGCWGAFHFIESPLIKLGRRL